MERSTGTVYLVGAGPGDPDLITVKGLELLRRAGVVVYDRLIPRELLLQCRRTAELIHVGKKPGRPSIAQEQINRMLIDRALQGKLVVRLKGGDPFVFGRGGEEQNACQKAGVHCVVVPGVSSALAAPASVGIPVTYRQKSRHFVVVTGHSNGEGDPLDYSALASIDTIVILMGRSKLAEFCESLMIAGKDPATPAACVEWATTQKQKLSTGSLQSIAALVEQDKLEPPVVTIVGEVAALAATSDSFARECWQLADPAHRGDHPWLS